MVEHPILRLPMHVLLQPPNVNETTAAEDVGSDFGATSHYLVVDQYQKANVYS